MDKHFKPTPKQSNRLEQLNVAYKKALGEVLLKEFPHLTNLTVADVLIDPSTQSGRVFLATTSSILEELTKKRGDIQNMLKKYIKGRYTPRLTFLADDNYLNHLDNLFEKVNKNEN